MKRRFPCMVLLAILVIANISATAQRRGARGEGQQDAGQNGWLHSLDEARAEARKGGMPMMVVIRCVP